MKNFVYAIALLAALTGCASAPEPVPAQYYSAQESPERVQLRKQITDDLASGKARRFRLQELLGKVTSPVDGAAIRAQLDDLQKQIDELERKLAQLGPATVDFTQQPPASSYGSGAVYTGPRGGRYTISPSGKKNYIRRK